MNTAVTLHGARDLRLEAQDAPALGAHDVRLRLGAGGICGSDLHYWQHGRVGAFVIRELTATAPAPTSSPNSASCFPCCPSEMAPIG